MLVTEGEKKLYTKPWKWIPHSFTKFDLIKLLLLPEMVVQMLYCFAHAENGPLLLSLSLLKNLLKVVL